jgi:hypothetical protein
MRPTKVAGKSNTATLIGPECALMPMTGRSAAPGAAPVSVGPESTMPPTSIQQREQKGIRAAGELAAPRHDFRARG